MEEHHDLITSYKYKNWSATRIVVECTLAGQCSCYSRICRRDHFFKAIPGVLKVFSSSTENPIMKLPTIAEDHCVTHFGRPNSVDRYVVSDQEPDRLISGVVERRTVYLFSKVTGRKWPLAIRSGATRSLQLSNKVLSLFEFRLGGWNIQDTTPTLWCWFTIVCTQDSLHWVSFAVHSFERHWHLAVAGSCTHPLDVVKVYVHCRSLEIPFPTRTIQTDANIKASLGIPVTLNHVYYSFLYFSVWLKKSVCRPHCIIYAADVLLLGPHWELWKDQGTSLTKW